MKNSIEIFLENIQPYAPTVLRVGLSLVFLWFGSQQLLHTSSWVGLIPDSVVSISGFSAVTLVYINGTFEVVFGLCLFLGFFTRISALLLAIHLLQITFIVGYNDVGVRDFGLSMATISVFLFGPSKCSLDEFFVKKL